MNLRQFLNLVPKGVRIAAASILAGSVLLALLSTAGFLFGHAGDNGHRAAGALIGLMAILFAVAFDAWLLSLGYVYTDARRRAMPPILWTLVAILVPNLLGFLLYFVLRRPITEACANCGQATSLEQRFCSWCGHPRPQAPSGTAPTGPGSSALDSFNSTGMTSA